MSLDEKVVAAKTFLETVLRPEDARSFATTLPASHQIPSAPSIKTSSKTSAGKRLLWMDEEKPDRVHTLWTPEFYDPRTSEQATDESYDLWLDTPERGIPFLTRLDLYGNESYTIEQARAVGLSPGTAPMHAKWLSIQGEGYKTLEEREAQQRIVAFWKLTLDSGMLTGTTWYYERGVEHSTAPGKIIRVELVGPDELISQKHNDITKATMDRNADVYERDVRATTQKSAWLYRLSQPNTESRSVVLGSYGFYGRYVILADYSVGRVLSMGLSDIKTV